MYRVISSRLCDSPPPSVWSCFGSFTSGSSPSFFWGFFPRSCAESTAGQGGRRGARAAVTTGPPPPLPEPPRGPASGRWATQGSRLPPAHADPAASPWLAVPGRTGLPPVLASGLGSRRHGDDPVLRPWPAILWAPAGSSLASRRSMVSGPSPPTSLHDLPAQRQGWKPADSRCTAALLGFRKALSTPAPPLAQTDRRQADI